MRDPADEEQEYLERKEREQLEASEQSVALAKKNGQQIELSAAFTREELLDKVAERCVEGLFGRYGNDSLESAMRKCVTDMVRERAEEKVEGVIEAHVTVAAMKICEEGFTQTDSYGQPKGQRKTIAAFVLEYLQSPNPNDYNNRDKSRLFATADRLVSEYIAKEIQPELVKLKERAKHALDTNVVAKVREALMAGLGLKE